ncbi:zonular occludens toxin domain-containing protein [Glaciimonas soli]|uniref:Zonular occludens toxin n=1 Tax=Glaciimonas soli TaxID=2590999 RepID=A0A843YRA2_9BURK|nr:zonular occludens toxin domain-containing protein [Glaciimonas soli]MQQ99255.1 zonular occludens toxin [Glaciimonas soli]
MLNLFTGLPGNGKTLYTLWYVKKWIEKENAERAKEGKELREIFYHGISNLMLPWTKIDPQKWMDCPPGSVIVIDEAQFVFEKKPNGSKLPAFYEQLAVHRHKGFDIVLITQNPSLVDNFVRKLVGKHLHIVRTFGMERAVVHEWMSVRESPERPSNRRDSIQHKWGYPKEVYAYYKSAEQHTVKRNIPMKVWGFGLVLIILACLVYYIYGSIQKKIHPDKALPAGAVAQQQVQGGVAHASYKNAVEDAHQFLFDRTPRVNGLPQTAPRYDEITKPTTAPYPASCVSNPKKCTCYTQQATPINVPEILCRDIVARGYFLDFDDKAGERNQMGKGSFAASDEIAKHSKEKPSYQLNEPLSKDVLSRGGFGEIDGDGYGVLATHTGGTQAIKSKL